MKSDSTYFDRTFYTEEEYRQKYIIGGAKTVLQQAIEDKENRGKLRDEEDRQKHKIINICENF